MDNKERIEKEATADARENYGNPNIASAYIRGATANYNKGWNDAIEACIARMQGYTNMTTSKVLEEKLESLKVLDENKKL